MSTDHATLCGAFDAILGALFEQPFDQLGQARLELDARRIAKDFARKTDVGEAMADIADACITGSVPPALAAADNFLGPQNRLYW